MGRPEYGLWITCRGFPSQFSTTEKHNSKDRTRQRQVKISKKEKPVSMNTSKGPIKARVGSFIEASKENPALSF